MTPNETALFITLLVIFVPVCLGCYCFGWWVRGTADAKTIYVERKTSNMTADEIADFERAFDHFDKGFYEMRQAFRRP